MLLKINSPTPPHCFPSYDPNFNIARNDQYRDRSIIFQGDGMESPRPFTPISWKISILATSSIDKSQLVHPSLHRAFALSLMSSSSDPVKQTNKQQQQQEKQNQKTETMKRKEALKKERQGKEGKTRRKGIKKGREEEKQEGRPSWIPSCWQSFYNETLLRDELTTFLI